MNSVFYYSVLQYKYAQSLGEVLNVGVLLLLPEQCNACFDVLVARPKDRKLYKSYEQAVQLLANQPRVNIIEEEKLDDYSQKTAEALR